MIKASDIFATSAHLSVRTALHTAGWTRNQHAARSLLELRHKLAWQSNAHGVTPLVRVEHLLDNPDALEALARELAGAGRRCATKAELEEIVKILEEAPVSENS